MQQPLATIVLTLAAGILALVLGSKVRIPSILFFLLFGVLLGPQFADLIQPNIFKQEFPHYISLLVALILFEGGTSLKFSQFHKISSSLRRLLTIGVLVTLIGGALAVKAIVGLSWTKAVLFGAIMVVTGPTVVIPILHRVRVKENLHQLLKWEAILIDSIGVIVAVVLFEILLSGHGSFFDAVVMFAGRFLVGGILGLVAGLFIYFGLTKKYLLRFEGDELGGFFVLAVNFLFYGIAEWILPESGLVAATTAGIYLGNQKFSLKEPVFHFSKQLTLLALSALFVLLSANVPVFKIQNVLKEGTFLLIVMIFVIRPLSIFIATLGDKCFSAREKMFASLFAPKGIVSASLASLFAIAFEEKALTERGVFLPLAFYVIVGSIFFYALFSGPIAALLKVRQKNEQGVLIIGVSSFGLLLAEELKKAGVLVNFLDSSPLHCWEAQNRGFEAHTGSGFDREFLENLDMHGIGKVVAITPNHEVNVLSCQAMSDYFGKANVFRAWDKTDSWDFVTTHLYDESCGHPLVSIRNLSEIDFFINHSKYKIQKEPTKDSFKISSEYNNASGKYFLFAISNQNIVFPSANKEIVSGSDVFYLTISDSLVGVNSATKDIAKV